MSYARYAVPSDRSPINPVRSQVNQAREVNHPAL
jgi:hypothetical protein